MRNKTALIVFAREPQEGKVKTRLSKDLPAKTVLSIYKAFIADTLETAARVRCDRCVIYYTHTADTIPFLRSFEGRFRLRRQTGADLGERMGRAFDDCQKERYDRAVIIGVDCLTLTPEEIESAFDQLNTQDCVIGPAKDGGYYLIGLKTPEKGLFTGIQWGGETVFESTLKKAEQLAKTVYVLENKEDIDTLEDLKTFADQIRNSDRALHTQQVLKELSYRFENKSVVS